MRNISERKKKLFQILHFAWRRISKIIFLRFQLQKELRTKNKKKYIEKLYIAVNQQKPCVGLKKYDHPQFPILSN